MLRLDPALPPVWRTSDALQFGLDARTVLHDPLPWQLRIVASLDRGLSAEDAIALAGAVGVVPADVEGFLRSLRAVLRDDGGPSAAACRLEIPDVVAPDATEALGAALRDAGIEVGAGGDAPPGTPVVLVAHAAVDPRRAAALIAADTPHLPVVILPERIEVGPFVDPGRTACLACVAAHRRERDPAWPMVIAQLMGRAAPTVTPSRLGEAGIVAAHLIRSAPVGDAPKRTRSVILDAGALHRRTQWHRPHAQCGCRSPEGTVTAAGSGSRRPMRATDSWPPS